MFAAEHAERYMPHGMLDERAERVKEVDMKGGTHRAGARRGESELYWRWKGRLNVITPTKATKAKLKPQSSQKPSM